MVATAHTKLTVHADHAIELRWPRPRIADYLRRVAAECPAFGDELRDAITRIESTACPIAMHVCIDLGAYPIPESPVATSFLLERF